jgi:hypothetical protein
MKQETLANVLSATPVQTKRDSESCCQVVHHQGTVAAM